MPIELGPPPVVRHRRASHSRYSYRAFFEALLANPGTWCSLPLDEINGANTYKKQCSILNGALSRHVKIQTTVQRNRLYARTFAPEETPATSAPEALQ